MLRKIRGKLEESLLLKACARALQGSLEKLPKENLVTSGPEVARKTETVAELPEPPLPVPIQKRVEAPRLKQPEVDPAPGGSKVTEKRTKDLGMMWRSVDKRHSLLQKKNRYCLK